MNNAIVRYPLPTLNLDLLKALVGWAKDDEVAMQDFIQKHGDKLAQWGFEGKWDQGYWGKQITNGVCETAYCIAGQAVIQAGYQFHYERVEDLDANRTLFTADWVYPVKQEGTWKDGKPKYVADTSREGFYTPHLAQRALGLTNLEREYLFDGDNTIGDVVYIASQIADRRDLNLGIEQPPESYRDRVVRIEGLFEHDDNFVDHAIRVIPDSAVANVTV